MSCYLQQAISLVFPCQVVNCAFLNNLMLKEAITLDYFYTLFAQQATLALFFIQNQQATLALFSSKLNKHARHTKTLFFVTSQSTKEHCNMPMKIVPSVIDQF
jgi:hypothetical protein